MTTLNYEKIILVIVLPPFDLGQLLREDNGLRNATYVYTYDNAGNITSKKTYALTAEGTTPTSATSTYSYGYSSLGWGDLLTSYRGQAITYDAIGNPLSYYNGSSYTFTWTGRQLTGAVKGSNSYSFTYNDEGIRTSKTKNGVTTTYYLNGSQIMAEETNGNVTVYLYDSQGLPIGMQYHGADYATDVWDTYWFEKNLQGDVVAVYTHAGTKLISYKYDAWGNTTTTYHNGGSSTTATKNPFKYRGYYYDADLGLYYLNTRYYDAKTGRFISPDDVGYLGANGDLNSYNLYAYCSNNPITYTDPSGHSIIATLFFIGISVGFAATAYADYADDGEVFNGSISTEDYITNSLVSGTIGAATGYFAPMISTFLSTGFTIPALANGSSAVITISGAQIVGAVATGLLINAITTGKSNGYWGQKYSNDHSPDHIHLKGPKTDIRIGRDGNPLKGDGPLNSQQRKALKKLWHEFEKIFQMK